MQETLINLQLIQFTKRGMYCPPGNFYVDPWFPVARAVITHGHADHARWGMKHYLCHHFTKPILQKRIAPDISVESMAYGETRVENGVQISFHPAGHILGSAQVRLEYQGYVCVISGDYKVQDDGLSAPFEPQRCHAFVTESTFGLPIYNWLPVQEANDQLRVSAEKNREQGKTSVFVGYSLGKAQRIMKALEGVDKLLVHSSIANLNTAFAESGISLPEYSVLPFEPVANDVRGKIVIVPPALLDSNVLRKIPDAATAICSGWMQVRGARRWRSADAGFAISDHADWPGLLSAIKATEAEQVFVTHGFTHVLSKYLNEIGISAQAVQTQFGNEEEPDEEDGLDDNPPKKVEAP